MLRPYMNRIGAGGGGTRSHESRGSGKGFTPFRPVQTLILGALPAIFLSLIPYAAFLHGNPEAWDNLFHQAHLATRNGTIFLRALTHPFRLLFLPRGHILFGDSRILSEDTECGAYGSFHSQLALQALLVGSLGVAWLLGRRRAEPCPFTRRLGLFYLLVLAIFLILPSKVFTKDQQGVPYAAFVWVLLLAPGLAKAWNLGVWPLRVLFTLVLAVTLNGMLLGHRVAVDHLTYTGERISPAGAPLWDVRRAARFLAGPHRVDHLGLDYDFAHGNAADIEREYRVYLAGNPAGSMASGRILDAELLLAHGITNSNPALAERDTGQGDYLVTWSFVTQDQLSVPWRSRKLLSQDVGRLRLFWWDP